VTHAGEIVMQGVRSMLDDNSLTEEAFLNGFDKLFGSAGITPTWRQSFVEV